MEDGAVDINALHKAFDDLPEGEKTGNMSKIISYIVELGQSGWAFRQAYKNVGELSTLGQHMERIESILERLTDDGKEAILEALDFQKKNCTEAMKDCYYDTCNISLEELYESVARDKCSKHDKTKQMILDTIKSYHENESNNMITNMVKGSAMVAAFQMVKIYVAWKQISAASNVIEDPNKFMAIKRNLQRMEEMVTEFLDLCERDPKDKRLDRKMTKINSLFASTLGKISDLKVTINGHIQRLDLLGDYAAVDSVVNLATAGTQAFQLWHTWERLTSFTKSIGVASVAVFTGLAAANLATFYLSRDKLAELRKDLHEAVRLQSMLEDLHDQAAQVIEELKE